MQIKSRQDFWAGLMFIALGVVFAWGATEYSFGSAARPGPGYFPFGLGILLALLGALVLLGALTLETADGGRIGRIAWRPLLIIVGAVLTVASWAIFIHGLGLTIPVWPKFIVG